MGPAAAAANGYAKHKITERNETGKKEERHVRDKLRSFLRILRWTDMKNERAKGKNGGTHSAQPATESLNMNDDDTPKKKQRTRRLK